MSGLVEGLFGSGAQARRAQEEQRRQREIQSISQARQEETLRQQEAETADQNRATGRPARGVRLLVASAPGGLAETLGG